jgi:hypothetical protein
MPTTPRRLPLAAVAVLTALALAAPACGAGRIRERTLPEYAPGVNPKAPFYNRVSPLTYAAPGVTTQQALYNTFQPLRAASRLPPWMFGYNPYPAPVVAPVPPGPAAGGLAR